MVIGQQGMLHCHRVPAWFEAACRRARLASPRPCSRLPSSGRLVSWNTCELAVGAVAVLQHRVDVGSISLRLPSSSTTSSTNSEIFERSSLALGHFCLLAEIDHLAVEAVARGAPLVLHDQRAAVVAEAPGCCAWSLYSFAMPSPGSAPRSRWSRPARIGMSQTRNSRVVKNGCGRMSHQIFLALSMQLVLISRLTKFS